MTPREAAIALNLIPGLGPVRIMRLLQVFASPELILESPSSLLMEIPGVGGAAGLPHFLLAEYRQPVQGTGTGG